MELALGLPLAFLIFLGGARLYERFGLSGPADSLRAGRWHYLIAGLLFDMALRRSGFYPDSLDDLRNIYLEIGLAWFGLQTGLDFDLRRYRNERTGRLLMEAARSGLTFLAIFLLVLAVAPLLNKFVDIQRPPGLIALLLAAFATSLRTPELIFYRGRKAFFYTSRQVFPPALCANPVALGLLGLLFPFVSENDFLEPGTPVGAAGVFGILFGAGLLLGVMLDFIFRAYRERRICIYLGLGVLAALGAPCSALDLPGIFVGFLGGAWLINTTVRRREVLELIEQGTGVIEPFFFLILGGVLASSLAAAWANPVHLFLFALSILGARGLFRAAGALVASRIFRTHTPWQVLMGLSIRPLGGLAVALAAQGFFLPLHLESGILLTGLVLAVFFSQILPAPEVAEPASLSRPAVQD